MSSFKERGSTASSKEQKLLTLVVDQNAFELIKQFKDSFESIKPTHRTRRPDRSTFSYLSTLGGADLSIGKIRYRAWYHDLNDFQALRIAKDVQGDSPQDVMMDFLYLVSRRLQDQQFCPIANITFHGNIRNHPVNVLLRFNDLYRAVPTPPQEYVYKKTPSALQKAREMLTGLQPQK